MTDGRDRDARGRYAEEVPADGVLAVFGDAGLPVLAATEVAAELGCSRPTAYDELEALVEAGEVRKKSVGARAVVYVRLDGRTEVPPTPRPHGVVSSIRVTVVSDGWNRESASARPRTYKRT